ncbi:M13 family metallopeptidase [Ferruginibacter albus]|uniref:M13 family metallopeptidase n=1 Tax=Ferruginibacter albus TaxID=2875540 RepID=UPI001CC8193A|nr:M13 family metallopeptidase [Ferruginibacter albus]UAY51358.1 M13 family metallopeptidase [Ferruginibacter albus]
MKYTLIVFMLMILYSEGSMAQYNKFPDSPGMDLSVKPGDDFYNYVNGNWIKKTKIPADEVSVGTWTDVYNKTNKRLHGILLSVSKANNQPGTLAQKVGDFFLSGMDTIGIDKRGYDPIKPILAQIETLKTNADIMPFVTSQALDANSLLLGVNVGPDQKNSKMNIAIFSQDGLGLPDRDYYFKDDSVTLTVVNGYKTYITKLFMQIGYNESTATQKMNEVYNLEKVLAASHRTNVELRDPQSNYHKVAIVDIDKQMPSLKWLSTMNELGLHTDSMDLEQPAYYQKLDSLLSSAPVSVWKSYLTAATLRNSARYLSSSFIKVRFDYFKILYGSQQMKPRWERVLYTIDEQLGFALGKIYVDKYFTPQAKQRMLEMVNNLQKSFEGRMNKLDWMSSETKKVAIDKLHAFIKKIGYPDKWFDYSKVVINKNKYFENLISCEKNLIAYNLGKLGKPVDKTEWQMTPPTLNAYYDPTYNEIVFPAGILVPPFFDVNADDALNYGAIGTVIGHEMTHGFDDQGSQYDKEGNLNNWWTSEDSAKFANKTKSIITQFDNFIVMDSVHINGSLTTGENIADLGGVNIAYDAFKMTKQGQSNNKLNGYTPDQRFFLAFATEWRSKYTPQLTMQLINTDPHSPDIARINEPLSNFTPFYKAFNVKPGDKMYVPEEKRIVIW